MEFWLNIKMKTQNILFSLFALFFMVASCEKEAMQSQTEINDEVLTLVEDEILADISFAELLDEGDDGIFWGDEGFTALKSAGIMANDCRTRTVKEEDNKKIVTLEFSNTPAGCNKSGTIIIVYHKNGDNLSNGTKTITYIDFVNKEGTKFNGVKSIIRGEGNYNIKANMEITRENGNGDPVFIVRNYDRQVHWICGLRTGRLEDNIKTITGQSDVIKTIIRGDEEVVKSYSRKITKPLLIVKACDVRIQAGTVKIEKANGTEVEIDYGDMPEDVDCDFTTTHDCNNTLKVTKDGTIYNVTVTVNDDGERSRVKVIQTDN